MHSGQPRPGRRRPVDLQPGQHLVGQVGAIADQRHVAAGDEGGFHARDDIARHGRAGHAQVVTEDDAVEAQLAPQDVAEPHARKAGRLRIDARVDHVRWHQRGEPGLDHHAEGNEVGAGNVGQAAFVDRDGHV